MNLPTVVPRPYQTEAIGKVHDAFTLYKRVLVAIATGLGKTIIGGMVIKDREGRAIFLVHRDELAQQALETLALILDPIHIGLVKAAHNQVEKRYIVASIQTLARPRRMEQLLETTMLRGPFMTILADEAHHTPSPSWMAVLQALGAFDSGLTGCRLLGLTATPERLDRVGLDNVFETVAYQMTILDGITSDPPYLVDLRARQVDAISLKGVKMAGGDYVDRSLGDAMLNQHGPQSIVAACAKYAPNRKKLVFLPTVAVAEVTAMEFQSTGVNAKLVTATTPDHERKEIVRNFRLGEVPALCNVGVLTEGFDAPPADCIVIGRPTKSRSLYIQMVGRGTRQFIGKSDCLILDLVGASNVHKIAGMHDLSGIALKQGESVKEALVRIEATQNTGPTEGIVAARTTREANLFATMPWMRLVDGSYGLVLPGSRSIFLYPDSNEHCTVIKQEPDGSRLQLYAQPLRLDYAQGLVEDLAKREGWLRTVQSASPWRKRPAPPLLRSQLRQRLHPEWNRPNLTSGEAQDFLDQMYLSTKVTIPGKRTRPW